MKKYILLLLIFNVITRYCVAQNGLNPVNGGNQQWVKLGNIAMPQGGNDCFLKIIGGAGYNALPWQEGNVNLHIRTSNWMSVDGNGYGFSATAEAYGQRFLSQIRIVPNSSGTNASAYDIYGLFGGWPGNTFFTAEYAPGAIWTPIVAGMSADPGGYSVTFLSTISNNTIISGNVGIGTNNLDAQLSVGGSIHAQAVNVDMTGWSDFVFNPSYKLASLKELKNYINVNHHLPGVPSEEQVKREGIDLGEMNSNLLKKIEELTLYLIALKKENDALKKEQGNINKKLKRHHVN